MTDRLKVHALDPAGATDGQVPKYDAATGRVIWATGGGGSTDPEVVRDTMAAALVAGAGITITPDDVADTITIAGSTDPEVVRDTMAAALVAGSGVTITPDDAGDTITIAATGGGGGGSLTVQDENGAVATGVTQIDFQGAGVTTTAGTGEVVVTIPGGGGGGGSIAVDDEGVQVSAAPTRLNFVGSGVQVLDSGSGVMKVYISGFPDWSVDAPPATPNAKDDEFNTDTGLWTTTPTAPTSMSAGTPRPSHLYIKANASSAALVGKYQALPALPCTVTAKITSHSATSGNARTGIFIGPASPTNGSAVQLCGWVQNSNAVQRVNQQLGGSWLGNGATQSMASQPLYLRATVTSATSVSFYASVDGWAWTLVETINPGFTPATVGVFANSEATGSAPEVYFDWFRVT